MSSELAARLQSVLDGPYAGLRRQTRERLCTLDLVDGFGIPDERLRAPIATAAQAAGAGTD